MNILTISDRVEPILYDRFEPDRFKNIDVVLACGDLPPEYLSFINARLNVPVFFVKGNHDIRYNFKAPDGCIDLNARMVKFQGFNILGIEGSRWYNGGQNQYHEHQMRRTLRGLRPLIWWKNGIDIVMTHAPPRHIHDADDRCHKGFKSFRWLIDKYSPRYFIHGHIHQNFTEASQRITEINGTTVVNTYGYFILDI